VMVAAERVYGRNKRTHLAVNNVSRTGDKGWYSSSIFTQLVKKFPVFY
jgi:hypothetical protein